MASGDARWQQALYHQNTRDRDDGGPELETRYPLTMANKVEMIIRSRAIET